MDGLSAEDDYRRTDPHSCRALCRPHEPPLPLERNLLANSVPVGDLKNSTNSAVNFENFANSVRNCFRTHLIARLRRLPIQRDDQERKFKYKNVELVRNALNCHKSASSAGTLDQSADNRPFSTQNCVQRKVSDKMEPQTAAVLDTRLDHRQGDRHNSARQLCCECRKRLDRLGVPNHSCLIPTGGASECIANSQVNRTTFSKPVPVYQSLKQQVCFKLTQIKPRNLIRLGECDLRLTNSSSRSNAASVYRHFLLLFMLFCLTSPLSAMSSLLSGASKPNQINSTVSAIHQTQHSQNVDQTNGKSNGTLATSSTFTSSDGSKNRTNRAIITSSPKRPDQPVVLLAGAPNRSNWQLNDSVHHLNHQLNYHQPTQSLPYNFNYPASHQKVPIKKSNESGVFFTSRSSNYSLPILKSPVANQTSNHRIVITRNQPSAKAEANSKNFKQLDATAILSDLNAQASQTNSNTNGNTNSIGSSRNNLVKNGQSNDKEDGKQAQDNKMESSKRSTQIEANLPETFYQQTKKRMIATSSVNGLALAQTRNPVLSSILKDVRPPSVSYSNPSSSSPNTVVAVPKNNNNNNNNKKQFTRVSPNSAQLNAYSLPAPVSTFTTNTSPTPMKKTPPSSTSKDAVITKDSIITKEMLKEMASKDQLNSRNGHSPNTDSVFVVHHHHLVSGQPASDRQSANKYALLSSTESSRSKNYYKNEEEDDRVSTASIFFDDEPSNNNLDKEKASNLDLSMLLKKEYDEQSNNKIIPRDQLNSQYGTANLNLFALLPTATTATISPTSSSTVASHERFNNKDPPVFSTTVRSIKVDLNRQNAVSHSNPNNGGNRTRPASIEKLHTTNNKLFGQREPSLNDIWRTTNGHARVPSTQTNSAKDATSNLTVNVVDMKQFQLNLAKTVVREPPKETRVKNDGNSSRDNSVKNTISTLTSTTTQPTLTSTGRFNQNANKHLNKQLDKNLFRYVSKTQLEDNKLMDNAMNSLDNGNIPNGLDALDSNQIYNRTMLMNDLKEYKDRHSKRPSNDTSGHTDEVLIRPVGDENELVNNALGSADSPGNRESYRLTTERLAYILIGSCCAISIFCLIVVAFSIRCRDMCAEYKNWKNAEKLALFNYRYQQHQQQQQRNHRLKLHQMAAFGNLVSESNSSSSQLISGHSGSSGAAAVNVGAVGALTNLSRPIFGPAPCCCCPTANVNNNKDKKHSKQHSANDQANFHFHPCPRGRLPFGAASSVFARFNGAANNPLANAGANLGQLNNENSLELLDEENDTLNGSLTDEFTTSKLKTTHGRNAPAGGNQPANGVCLQCTCEDSFEDEESDLGSLSQVPTAIKNASSAQQYLRPNQLINHTHAKSHHFSSSNVNNHHHINHHTSNQNHNNSKQHKQRGVFQPMDNNWISQSSMIVDELHRKHNHRLINGNNQAKYECVLSSEHLCSLYSMPLVFWSSYCESLI